MKCGVETDHLRNVWPLPRSDFDGCQVGGEMQRREGDQPAESTQNWWGTADGLREIWAAVHNAMPDCRDFLAGKMGFEPGLERAEGAFGVFDFGLVEILVEKNFARHVLYSYVWRCANAVN